MSGRKTMLRRAMEKLEKEGEVLNLCVARVIERAKLVIERKEHVDNCDECSRAYRSSLKEVQAAIELIRNANSLCYDVDVRGNKETAPCQLDSVGSGTASVTVKHDAMVVNSLTLFREGGHSICPNPFEPRCGEIYKVFVSNVVTPDEIYVHVQSPEYSGMQRMEMLMRKYYSRHLMSFESKSVLKKYCKGYCAVLHNNRWVRAEILDIPLEDVGVVTVFLIDYGITLSYEFRFIQPLVDYFVDYPQYAVQCRLPVVPPFEEQSWSQESLDALASCVSGFNMFQMTIVSILKNNKVPYVMLSCEEGVFQLNVSDYMVLNGYAAHAHLTGYM